MAGILLAVIGVVLVVWGIATGPWVITLLGAVVMGVGFWAFQHLRALGVLTPQGSVDVGVTRAHDMERAALARVKETLVGLPVRPEVLENASTGLVGRLERLREFLGDHSDRSERAHRLGLDIGAIEDRVRALGRRLGVEIPPDAANGAPLLERRLEQARRAKEEGLRAQRELVRISRESERLRARARASADRVRDLEAKITHLGRGSLKKGLERIRKRAEARAAATRLRDDLERTHGGPDVVRREVRAFESQEGMDVDEGTLQTCRDRLERLGDEAQELASTIERLAVEVATLGKGESAVEVDGRIETLRVERAELERERDRKVLLANLITEADRRFREVHQPDVVRRAQDYVASITGGRYSSLVMTDEKPPRSVRLRTAEGPLVDVGSSLSKGTKEQVYLALRLAVADHLDAGAERLPLFMDEVLVNWDVERARRGLELLHRLSQNRQVFLFTCHPPLAEELAQSGARRIELGVTD